MELLLFYEKESSPWLHSCCLQPYKFHYFQLKETDWEVGKKFDILIYKKETDPSTLLHFQLIIITHDSSSYHDFHSFYEEIQSEFPISVTTKNLFLSLAESIAQTLNVTSCYVGGGTKMRDIGHGRQKS
jgi:hypothetical protein